MTTPGKLGYATPWLCLIAAATAIALTTTALYAQTVTVTGCVAPGTESSCLVVKDGDQTYNISAASPQPAWDKRVKLTGTRATGGAGSCEGARLTDIKWSYDFNQQPPCPASFSLNDESASPIAGLGQWAGTWITHTKWGGRTGTWRDERRIVITPEGKITVGDEEIKGALYSPSSKVLLWFMKDGNRSNVLATFGTTMASDPYFFNPPVQGPVFSGAYQEGSDGLVDFRGQKTGQ
jgi:hypothetical protein